MLQGTKERILAARGGGLWQQHDSLGLSFSSAEFKNKRGRERSRLREREREKVSVWQQGAVDGGCKGGLRRLWRWRKSVVVACLLKAEIEREIRERGGGNERREIRVRFCYI